ncbi:MAG: SpoIIE family protein phosphatase [Balneolia bacterium]|nr:SpoIIE family protein phosphatase [Balneolia bacterium]
MNNGARKILIVDDEPDLQILMLQRFKKQVQSGLFEFLFAEDGVEALTIVKGNPGVSLILSDINMPGMDGLSLLTELQALKLHSLKTVMVSAYGDMENIRTAMNRGAYDFVTKPINFADLQTTIEKTLREIERIEKSIENELQLRAITTDLDMAARIQQQILKKEFPAFPEDERFDIFAHMIAAKHVGGDFFDFFKTGDDKLVFFIGDVAGKGMPASIYMAVCDTMLKSIGSETADPAACLNRVNQMLIPVSELTTFVTAFYGVLDLRTGEFSYCNGGHNLPFLLRADGTVSMLEDVGGLLLGKFGFAQYESHTITLKPGDTLFTYTDGISEAENGNRELYGEDRMMRLLERTIGKPVETVVKSAFLDVLKFAEAHEQSDDITAMAVRFGGLS